MALTKPQAEILAKIAEKAQHVDTSYRPAKRLVELGYAEWRGRWVDNLLTITDAGRAALMRTR